MNKEYNQIKRLVKADVKFLVNYGKAENPRIEDGRIVFPSIVQGADFIVSETDSIQRKDDCFIVRAFEEGECILEPYWSMSTAETAPEVVLADEIEFNEPKDITLDNAYCRCFGERGERGERMDTLLEQELEEAWAQRLSK